MTEASEFTTNDRYLIHEYNKHGSSDYYLCDIGDKTFVIPLRYMTKAQDGTEGKKLFKKELLDFQNEELKKYQAADKKIRKINFLDDEFIVPYDAPEVFNSEDIAHQIIKKAEVKYNAVVNAHRMLNEITSTDFSTTALNKYTKKLGLQNKTILLAPDAIKHLEIYKFLCQHLQAHKKKAPQTIIKIAKKIRTKILNNEFKALKKYKPKYWKFALLAGMLSASAYHLFHSVKQETTDFTPPIIDIKTDTTPTFTDFKGTTYTDTLGNLRQMSKLQPQIMTVLLSIEGFSEDAFLDGRGNPTIGSGFTKLIHEDGSETKVKLGDKTTIKKDLIQNTRYIEREFPAILGDNMGRTITPEEIYACIGSGYCWGTDKFIESSFFNSLKENKSTTEQCRKLSGFRTPKGLLKREFVLAQLLSGNWKVEDLLDMPIYYIKDKGYVHCGIYSLDFHDCIPCKKDKKGHYIKDKKGYEIPIIEKDGFCKNFFQPSAKKILQKILNNPVNRGIPYKTVRELLHKDLLAKLNDKSAQQATIFAMQAINQFQK